MEFGGSEFQAPTLFVFEDPGLKAPPRSPQTLPTEKEDNFQLLSLVLEGKVGRRIAINKLSEPPGEADRRIEVVSWEPNFPQGHLPACARPSGDSSAD